MIRTKRKGPIVIDLTGPQGNAYFLLGTAKNLAKQLDFNANEITNEMMSGNYDVSVSSKSISHFQNTKLPIQYWIALEPDSSISK